MNLVVRLTRDLRCAKLVIYSCFDIEPKVLLALQVESYHRTPSSTFPQYAKNFGNANHESHKRTSERASCYFNRRNSCYPVP